MNIAYTAPAATFEITATVPRYDIYVQIHRALRLFMSDTLGRLGCLDPDDRDEVHAVSDQLNALLAMCRQHLDHENRFLHPAMEARRPGSSSRVAGEHAEHLEEIAALEAEAASLRAVPTAPRVLRLYRHFALFVAANLRHMHVEETAHNNALWAEYSDDEIIDIEQRLVATLDVEERSMVLHWMTRALPPAERALWFRGMREQIPPGEFAQALDAARAALDDKSWAKLSRSLGDQAVHGPASFAMSEVRVSSVRG